MRKKVAAAKTKMHEALAILLPRDVVVVEMPTVGAHHHWHRPWDDLLVDPHLTRRTVPDLERAPQGITWLRLGTAADGSLAGKTLLHRQG